MTLQPWLVAAFEQSWVPGQLYNNCNGLTCRWCTVAKDPMIMQSWELCRLHLRRQDIVVRCV